MFPGISCVAVGQGKPQEHESGVKNISGHLGEDDCLRRESVYRKYKSKTSRGKEGLMTNVRHAGRRGLESTPESGSWSGGVANRRGGSQRQ